MSNLNTIPPTNPSPVLTVVYQIRLLDLFLISALFMLRMMAGLFVALLAYDILRRVLSQDDRPIGDRVLDVFIFAFLLAAICGILGLLGALIMTLPRRRLTGISSTAQVLEHAFRDEAPDVLHEFRWQAITQVRWIVGMILVRTVAGLVIIIPMRSFQNEAAANSFFNELEGRWKKSRASGT